LTHRRDYEHCDDRDNRFGDPTLKTTALCLALSLVVGGSAHAAERGDAGAFDKWLTPDSPECVPVADIKAVGSAIDLTQDQFRFVQALYIAIPPTSRKLPPGDRGIIVGASDGTAMVALVDDDKTCARFLAPDFVIQMLNDVKAGKVEHMGKPL
jgi:hypothetical protein